jgi:hypothetical protein
MESTYCCAASRRPTSNDEIEAGQQIIAHPWTAVSKAYIATISVSGLAAQGLHVVRACVLNIAIAIRVLGFRLLACMRAHPIKHLIEELSCGSIEGDGSNHESPPAGGLVAAFVVYAACTGAQEPACQNCDTVALWRQHCHTDRTQPPESREKVWMQALSCNDLQFPYQPAGKTGWRG